MTRVRTTTLARMKSAGRKIPVLTAYDATMAGLLEAAGVEVILVGDSLGMVALGYDTTVPVTMDDMLHHTKAVARGAKRALVIADMPFLSYQISPAETLRNAGRLLQEGGAAAVKLEGACVDTIRTLAGAGIAVMGHLGLLPQHVNRLGGYPKAGDTSAAAAQLEQDAEAMEQAGAFALVLESIPDELARRISSRLKIPTIGIGAGPHCDGQVLVTSDVLGLTLGPVPPFARQFASLGDLAQQAVKAYCEDVQEARFPPEPDK